VTFLFVAQCLNQLRHHVAHSFMWYVSDTTERVDEIHLLLQLVLQPLVVFGLLYDFVPQSSIPTLFSAASHFHPI
jgi:hypothetical protein